MANHPGLKVQISAGITGTSTAMTKEPCTLSTDRKTASIAAAGKRFIDPNAAVTVYVGASAGEAVEVPANTYVLYRGGGKVVFHTDSYPGVGDNVYVTGRYLPFAVVGECRSVQLSNSFDVKDVTTMDPDNTGWKKSKAMLRDGSVTLSGFLDDAVLNYIDADAIVEYCFIEITIASVFIWSAVCTMNSFNVGMPQDDMVSNERSFNLHGPAWYSVL